MSEFMIPKMFYAMWYEKDVKTHLTEDTKLDIAKRISELTLNAPIWLDPNKNYISDFPELKPYSSNGRITGLQLCAVMESIVKGIQGDG